MEVRMKEIKLIRLLLKQNSLAVHYILNYSFKNHTHLVSLMLQQQKSFSSTFLVLVKSFGQKQLKNRLVGTNLKKQNP